MEEFLPNDYLKSFIRYYRIFESPDETLNRILPGTSFAIAFRLSGKISYIKDNEITSIPSAIIIGLQKSVSVINYVARTGTLVIYFNTVGIAGFIKESLYEFFEQSVALADFIQRSEINDVEERLAELVDNRSKIDFIEQFLSAKLQHSKSDLLIKEAISKIYLSNGVIKIQTLAKVLNISQDAFEKRFRRTVGSTPKRFSSIVKLQKIITLKTAETSVFNLAIEHGYYDQSHFIKDFKLFTGMTPTEFFETKSYW